MLVYVRPSNEALLRARVPGAQDQRGCPSILLHFGDRCRESVVENREESGCTCGVLEERSADTLQMRRHP